MLDVACGGGDVPIGVAGALQRAKIRVQLTLSDRSDVALEQAQRLAKDRGISAAALPADAVEALPRGEFDVVTNSLFLHHLERGEVVRVLGNMRKAVRSGGLVVISDLRRSRAGWLLAWVGCRVLSRSKVVHFDGPVSVRAAWTLEELGAMAREAGMGSARIERAWPWRMLVTWQQSAASSHDRSIAAPAEVGAGR
jgi:2-polyprenyl-3-methyl-5-hydroxy-6-metoxy-1,4-benzoquinol methylase